MARSVPSNVTNTVFKKNFKYAVFNVTTLPGKTEHFFRTMDGDCDDIIPFKFRKSLLVLIVDRNNWSTVLT